MEWGDPGAERYRKIVAKLQAQIGIVRGQERKDYSDALHGW
jgi:hypothetical protein